MVGSLSLCICGFSTEPTGPSIRLLQCWRNRDGDMVASMRDREASAYLRCSVQLIRLCHLHLRFTTDRSAFTRCVACAPYAFQGNRRCTGNLRRIKPYYVERDASPIRTHVLHSASCWHDYRPILYRSSLRQLRHWTWKCRAVGCPQVRGASVHWVPYCDGGFRLHRSILQRQPHDGAAPVISAHIRIFVFGLGFRGVCVLPSSKRHSGHERELIVRPALHGTARSSPPGRRTFGRRYLQPPAERDAKRDKNEEVHHARRNDLGSSKQGLGWQVPR